MARSSQASLRSKSYFFLSSDRGGSLTSHMPSSACNFLGIEAPSTTARATAARDRRRCLTLASLSRGERNGRWQLGRARHPSPLPEVERGAEEFSPLPSGERGEEFCSPLPAS